LQQRNFHCISAYRRRQLQDALVTKALCGSSHRHPRSARTITSITSITNTNTSTIATSFDTAVAILSASHTSAAIVAVNGFNVLDGERSYPLAVSLILHQYYAI
jgi:hypothetical protein